MRTKPQYTQFFNVAIIIALLLAPILPSESPQFARTVATTVTDAGEPQLPTSRVPDSTNPPVPTTTDDTVQPAATLSAATKFHLDASEHFVVINSSGVEPATINVEVGDSVTWHNATGTTVRLKSGTPPEDPGPSTGGANIFLPIITGGGAQSAASEAGGATTSAAGGGTIDEQLAPGADFTYTFDSASTIAYYLDRTGYPTGRVLVETPRPTTIRESSPANGEDGVAATRETIIEFSRPINAAGVTAANFAARFGSRTLNARLHHSADGKRVTLFYDAVLPASARIQVTVNGDGITDTNGQKIDGNDDGQPGGTATIDFDTLSVTVVPGTSVCGRVFASELAADGNTSVNVPLQGATITVDGMESTLKATTDGEGNFCLDPAPAGRFFVHIDGRTARNGVPAGAYYPFVGKAWGSVVGQQSSVGNIYLPLVQPGTLQDVSNTQETRITFADSVRQQFPEFTGTEIYVPANSLMRDDGSRGGKVGIAPVPPDRLPGELPEGLNFPLVITVQTDGATNFDKPAPICFPNLPDPDTNVKLAAGEKSALWSFNHDTGQFEVVGPMTVSDDGTLVCTDPGVGVPAPGWHGSQPGVPVSNLPPVTLPDQDQDNIPDFCEKEKPKLDTPYNFQFQCIRELTCENVYDNQGNPSWGQGFPGYLFDYIDNLSIKSATEIECPWYKHSTLCLMEAGNYHVENELRPGFASYCEVVEDESDINQWTEDHNRFLEEAVIPCFLKANVEGEIDDITALVALGVTVSRVVNLREVTQNVCRANFSATSFSANQSSFRNFTLPPLPDPQDWLVGLDTELDIEAKQFFLQTGTSLQLKVSKKAPDGQITDLTSSVTGTRYYINYGSKFATIDNEGRLSVITAPAPIATIPAMLLIVAENNGEIGVGQFAIIDKDTDQDWIVDSYEERFGLNYYVPNEISADSDNDGLSDISELLVNLNPISGDSDRDGIGDQLEVIALTDPLTPGTYEFVKQKRMHYYVVQNQDSGTVIRGHTGNGGTIQAINVAANANHQLWVLQPETLLMGVATFRTPSSGNSYTIPSVLLKPTTGMDNDDDTLIGEIEYILGTDPNNPDTDNDGIPDGTEVQNGTDPLDGIAARTGVVGAADTPGTALDVCVVNNLAAVADGEAGVALFNVFDAMNPTIVAQVDTPGTAQAIACDSGLVAVADKDSGIAIIDTTNPANAAIRRQVALTGAAQGVATVNGLVYAGSAGGQLAVIDSVNGEILGSVNLGEAIDEIAVAGDNLYVLTKSTLVIYALWDGGLAELGRTTAEGRVSPLEFGRKLFVGGGRAYVGYFTGYSVFDVSDPANPRLQGTPPATQAAIHGMASTGSGELVAVTSFSGPSSLAVSLYDDSDPTDVTKFLTSYDTPGSPRGVALNNGLAYIADSTAGLQVVNYLSYDSGRTAPTLTLGGSFTGDRVEENKLTRITANATDDVQIRLVEFYVDGALVATDGSYPFEQRFVTPRMADQATVKLRVRAVDTGGNEAWTNEQTLTLVPDATPPRVLRYTPAAGSNPADSVRGLSVTFSEAINQNTLTATNLKIVGAGADNQLGTGDDPPMTGGTLAFDTDTNTASLTFGSPLPAGIYRATVAAAISDPAGNKLASDLVWDFGVGQRIPIGTVIAGEIGVAGEQDVYNFVATPGQRVYFDDQNASRQSYFYWKLQDTSGKQIFQDTIDGYDAGVYYLELGGEYTLTVWGYQTTTGTYQFQLRSNLPDAFTIAIGDTVKDGQPGTGAGRIELPGNFDRYTFTATPNQRVYFDDQNASRANYFYWNLYDSSGTRIFQEDLDDSDPGVYYLEKGGQYTINVWSYTDNAGTYQFQLRSNPPEKFTIAIGDVVQNGQPGSGAGNIEIPGNVDQYTFTATPNQRVYFDDQNASRPNYFYWNLYDSSGTRIFQDDLDNSDPGVYYLEKGGQYTINVWSYTNNAGTYQFQLRSNPPDKFTINIGDVIQNGQPGAGAGNIEIPGNVDQYTFTATPNQRVYFDDQNASRPNYFYWNLYDSSGTRIFQDDLDNSDPGVYYLEKGGEYTINVWSYTNNAGTYQFQLRSNPADRFAIAIGDTIQNNQPGTGAGNIEIPGNVDQYTFTATPNQRVYFDDQNASRPNYFYWNLYDSDGTRIFQDDLDDSDPGAYDLTKGGEYTINVWSYTNNAGTYQFQLRSNPPDAFTINIGNTVSDGQPGPGAGNIEIPGNVDQYSFTATPGERVYFDDQGASRSGYFYWEVYDANGTRVFQDTLNNTDPGAYTLALGGEYTIYAWSYVNNAGTYQFQIRSATAADVNAPRDPATVEADQANNGEAIPPMTTPMGENMDEQADSAESPPTELNTIYLPLITSE